MFNNPQFPYAGKRQLMRNPEPTELMPIANYLVVGRLAGIMQSQQFKPFSTLGINERFSTQSYYDVGGVGILTGQNINQPLSTKPQF